MSKINRPAVIRKIRELYYILSFAVKSQNIKSGVTKYGADEIAYPPAEGSPKVRLRGVRICRGKIKRGEKT